MELRHTRLISQESLKEKETSNSNIMCDDYYEISFNVMPVIMESGCYYKWLSHSGMKLHKKDTQISHS